MRCCIGEEKDRTNQPVPNSEVARGNDQSAAEQKREIDLTICMLDKDTTAIKNPNILFIFSGQGTQYPWMGVSLYKEEPVFRATLDHCSSLVRGWDPNLNIVKELHKGKEESQVYSAHMALVLIPALQMALVQLLQSKGVRPAGNDRKLCSVCDVR